MESPSYYAIIPSHVRYDKSITANAKLLYWEITSLSNSTWFCWAWDAYFCRLYGVSKRSIQAWFSSLEKAGYISREIEYKKGSAEIFRRYCRILPYPSEEIFVDPSEEIFVDNTTTNNTKTNIKIEESTKKPQLQSLEEKVNEYRTTYAAAMIQSFLLYRTEKNSKWKERWQCQKFFEVGKRLKTWKLKDDQRKKKEPIESAASRSVRIDQQVQSQKSLTPKYTWNAITNLQRSVEQWESDRGGDID